MRCTDAISSHLAVKPIHAVGDKWSAWWGSLGQQDAVYIALLCCNCVCPQLLSRVPQRVGNNDISLRCALRHCLPNRAAELAAAGTGCAVPSCTRSAFLPVNSSTVSPSRSCTLRSRWSSSLLSLRHAHTFTWLCCGVVFSQRAQVFRLWFSLLFLFFPLLSSWLLNLSTDIK